MVVVRKYGNKNIAIFIVLLLILSFICFSFLWLFNNNLAKSEIHKVISERNGKVLSIKKVELEDSPFILTMESRKGKREQYSNTFYKIIYSKENKNYVAWLRAVDGIFTINGETKDREDKVVEEKPENKELIRTYGERWIFE